MSQPIDEEAFASSPLVSAINDYLESASSITECLRCGGRRRTFASTPLKYWRKICTDGRRERAAPQSSQS
jgi:hypothetical protein